MGHGQDGVFSEPFNAGFVQRDGPVSRRAETARDGLKVTTITPGYIKTNISLNALNGDGREFGKVDDDIANGMDVNKCAEVILDGMRKGKPEIPVGEGFEMKALTLKRFFPKLVFKKVESMTPQ